MNVNRHAMIRIVAVAALLMVPNARVPAQAPESELEKGFMNPPDAAKPRAWWHWMNGNISKEGITADLEIGRAHV